MNKLSWHKLTQVRIRIIGAMAAALLASNAHAGQIYSYITNFTKTANAQLNLEAAFPSGYYVTTNSFATPFEMVTNANGKNYSEISSAISPLVISNIDLSGVTSVFTLMNAYSPEPGAMATVTFVGDAGATQTFTLNGGINIRDFYNGVFVNGINGTTTEGAFEIDNTVGAGGTGNSSTGDFGTYRFDEQEYVLSGELTRQTLQTIIISNTYNPATPILLGVTALAGLPSLTIQYTNSNAVLSWPSSASLFSLEQSSSLTGGGWARTTNNVVIGNGQCQVTVPATLSAQYFRLIYP